MTLISAVMVTQLSAPPRNCTSNKDKQTSESHDKSRENGRWTQLLTQFFSVLFCVPQFATAEVAVTFIKDEFGPQVMRFLKREELLTLVVCIVYLLLGIPHITQVAMKLFETTF